MPFVVIINVIDILNGQKFSFPMNSDSSYRMKHLKDEMNSLVHRFGDHRLLFIRNGRIVDDEEYILSARSRTTNLEPSSTIDFYFMAQPKAKVVSQEETVYEIDQVHLAAAKEWMVSHSSYSNTEEVSRRQYIVQSLQQLVPDDKFDKSVPSTPGPATAAPPNAVPDPDPLLAIQWFDFNALGRIILGYFFFASGSSVVKQFCYINGAVFYYLYSTGIWKFLLDYLTDHFDIHDEVTPGENNPNTPVSDTDATSPTHGDATPAVPIFDENGVEIPPANPAPQVAPADGRVVPWTERALIGFKTFCTSGAPIPTGRVGGFALDALSLLASLTLSLIPEWSPHGRA